MYTVVGPAGNVMLATPIPTMRKVSNNLKIPSNLENLNKRLLSSPNAWTANTSNMLNNIRNNNWRRATRDDLIKFIMYGYYGALAIIKFNLVGKNGSSNSINKFHRFYSTISSRNAFNTSMISPKALWRRLQSIEDEKVLLKMAKIVAW